jgi:hypothetical protein
MYDVQRGVTVRQNGRFLEGTPSPGYEMQMHLTIRLREGGTVTAPG